MYYQLISQVSIASRTGDNASVVPNDEPTTWTLSRQDPFRDGENSIASQLLDEKQLKTFSSNDAASGSLDLIPAVRGTKRFKWMKEMNMFLYYSNRMITRMETTRSHAMPVAMLDPFQQTNVCSRCLELPNKKSRISCTNADPYLHLIGWLQMSLVLSNMKSCAQAQEACACRQVVLLVQVVEWLSDL